MWIRWHRDLARTAGLRASVRPLPSRGTRTLQPGPVPEVAGRSPPRRWLCPVSPGTATRSLLLAPPGAAGCGGSSWSLRGWSKGLPGVLPAAPSAGVAALPSIPSPAIDPCPDRWALPCGRGAVLPGRAGEMAFRRAWSGLQHRSLVPRQRSIRPVISRAQSEGLGGEQRNARLAAAARGHGMLGSRPSGTISAGTSADLSLPQFPRAELG